MHARLPLACCHCPVPALLPRAWCVCGVGAAVHVPVLAAAAAVVALPEAAFLVAVCARSATPISFSFYFLAPAVAVLAVPAALWVAVEGAGRSELCRSSAAPEK